MNEKNHEILQNVNQPVIDDICGLVEAGKSTEAVKLLLELEGHWLTREQVENFINLVEKKRE